ncbi:hypothetical protein H0Z60_11200 [Ectothiorhodospiraceae bacterium WFHF3C12]|nr:hypothetical protein [Ectothiorhodospiraceae bacterium WFHF3C12]
MNREIFMILGLALAGAALALGLHLARRAALGRAGSLASGLSHGGLGMATVLAVGAAAFTGGTLRLLNAALLFYCLALVGGLFVLIFRLQREPPPMFMVYLHAASAVAATFLLAIAVL